MKRTHALVISLLLGVALAAGSLAVIHTASGGSSGQGTTSGAAIAKRKAALDSYETSLKAALAQKPPALPPLVKIPKAAAPAVSSAPRVVYVRAQVPSSSQTGGDDRFERENEAEGVAAGGEGGERDD